MKKALIIVFAVLTLRGSPQSGDIDTLYYLHETTHFIPEYAIAEEIFNLHTKYFPQLNWQSYKLLEIHLLLRPGGIGDTIQSISFYKDTPQQLVFTQSINKTLESSDVFPNWFKIIIDNQTPITGEIEVPAWWGELCEVDPAQTSGNTIGFYDASQSWGVFHDLPIKLIIERVPVGVENEFQTNFNFESYQNYPNPFNPSTKIRYSVPCVGARCIVPVLIKVYDVLGNEVATLVDEYKPAGSYEVEFKTVGMRHASSATNVLSSGVYYYQLKAGGFVQTKKMLLVR